MDQFTAYTCIKGSGSMATMTVINLSGMDGGWIMTLKNVHNNIIMCMFVYYMYSAACVCVWFNYCSQALSGWP